MENPLTSEHETTPMPNAKTISIKVFGVGSAGLNVLENVAKTAIPGAGFVAIGPDEESLARSGIAEKICLETRQLRGLGTGGDPDRGRAVAEENLPKLKSACEGAQAVFIVCGLGGGAGTGISPVLARAAKEAGALVLAFVTLPFDCEGNRRQRLAEFGLEELKAAADGVICLPNQKVFKLIDENTSVVETFKTTNELLAEGVAGVWRLMANKGLIEIQFADLCALLRDRHGESSFATAEAMGPTRSHDAMEKLFAHPMLDGGDMLAQSDAVLVSLIGGPDLTMAEVNRVMEQINGKCAKAQVIMGAAIDDAFADRLTVTLFATRRVGHVAAGRFVQRDAAHPEESLDEHLLNREPARRPNSRFIPPPPPLPPEQMEQLMSRRGGSRVRKGIPKLRQTQLPLEIVSKGRFDKSEPTIHKGEDLDVPTYIRRGVSLN